eukprot:TRINITY_DN5445_c0_g1_i1.p1 TRINITY_DN5445_c0_g1~~TRINITY_DN5445_c0_g1_i1.p1  ORF type:complete len:246 (+),score=70.78 TRINITY_DN5445_c0_g1_i1:70-738(+)
MVKGMKSMKTAPAKVDEKAKAKAKVTKKPVTEVVGKDARNRDPVLRKLEQAKTYQLRKLRNPECTEGNLATKVKHQTKIRTKIAQIEKMKQERHEDIQMQILKGQEKTNELIENVTRDQTKVILDRLDQLEDQKYENYGLNVVRGQAITDDIHWAAHGISSNLGPATNWRSKENTLQFHDSEASMECEDGEEEEDAEPRSESETGETPGAASSKQAVASDTD